MQITPTKGHYVIEIAEKPQETAGGKLILAEGDANSAPVIGTIISVPEQNTYAIGDRLIFRKYAVDELTLSTDEGQKKVWILEERDILGVLTN